MSPFLRVTKPDSLEYLTYIFSWYILSFRVTLGRSLLRSGLPKRPTPRKRCMDSPKNLDPIRRFETACRQRGVPVTVQRRRIFEALLGRTDHPTPDQVYISLKDTLPDLSRTTVYRVLETLAGLGVLAKSCSPSAATRVDPRIARHHHLVCRRCDRLIDVEDAAVEHRIRPPDLRQQAFVIEDYSIYFTGLCAACQEAEKASHPSKRPKRPSARKAQPPTRRAPRS